MDIVSIPGSRILELARIAFATPDVDFLCFGESDQPSPASACAAAVAALDARGTRYPDVRGLPELRSALADYLTKLHALPMAEERIQITASGITAVSVASARDSARRRSSGSAQPAGRTLATQHSYVGHRCMNSP